MHRRAILTSLGTGLVAGCLAHDGSPGVSGSSNESDIDARLDAMDDLASEVIHVARTNDPPAWAESVDRPAGHAELFESRTGALVEVPFEHVDPAREDAVREFIRETDIDRSRLLSVVGVGLGNTEVTVAVDRLGVHEGELVGSATVQNAEPGDSIDTYASVLVRATVEDERLPRTATIHIDAIHDRETVVEATVD